jgi:hypothetical protein
MKYEASMATHGNWQVVQRDHEGMAVGNAGVLFWGKDSEQLAKMYASWMNQMSNPLGDPNDVGYTAGRHPATEVEADYVDPQLVEAKPVKFREFL